MVLGQYLLFYHLCIPVIAVTRVRDDILLVLNFVPVDVGVSAKDSHLVLSRPLHVCFANRLVEPCNWRGLRTNEANGVAPRLLDLLQGNIFAAYILIDRRLI
jgi:hypothetical protein